jgi:orotate phosphoribosyltransferase
MDTFRADFLRLSLQMGALRFGEFTLKSGRISPYFFNAGLFSTGRSIAALTAAYAQSLVNANVPFDMLFGPAYKGISLATGTAMALAAAHARDVPFACNRKEAKDHGEGGVLIGAPLQGRVIIVDDVISAGTSVRESVALIRASGATPAAVLIAIDREERGQHQLSAAQEVQQQFAIPVIAVARLSDLLHLVAHDQTLAGHRLAMNAYRERYGAPVVL